MYVAWLDRCYGFEAFMKVHFSLGTRRGLYTMYVMYDNIIFSYIFDFLFLYATRMTVILNDF